MPSVLKKALTRMRPEPVMPGPRGQVVGFVNDHRNGWFDKEAGQLAKGFPISKDDVFIDVGCGDGGVAKFAAQMGSEVIATDIDPRAVKRTAEMLKHSGSTRFRVEVSDSNPLPVADNTCTRVACLEVLEHVDSPQQLITELVRIAKPGALFLLAAPDERSEAMQQGLAPAAYWESPNHLRVFSRVAFSTLVENAGLTIENRQYKSFFWAMWWTLFWAADQDLGDQEKPVLYHWSQTWHELMKTKEGDKIAKKLDEFMPKSQVIVARKSA